MGRPRSSLPQAEARKQVRRHAAQSESFLHKHYNQLHSLARYAQDDAPPSTARTYRKRKLASAQASRDKTRRIAELQQRYPVGDIWSYTWPLALPQLPAHSQTPTQRVMQLVEQVVKETFEADYAMFRSPEWAKEHRIRKDHLEKIIVDPNEVEESATAAKALVETALSRVIAGVKKGAIGVQSSSSPAKSGSACKDVRVQSEGIVGPEPRETQPSSAHVDSISAEDVELDERELDQEMGREPYAMDWRGLLDYLESTGGTSKTSQWRNWHLLNAIAQTRQRCEELFGHQ